MSNHEIHEKHGIDLDKVRLWIVRDLLEPRRMIG